MRGHALHGRAQRERIEDVLQNGDAQHQIESPARIELRQILHQEPAAACKTGVLGPALRLRDHRGTQIDARHDSTP